MKKCKHCGKEFEPKNPKGKFCSDKCRVYASRAVKPEKPIIDYTPQLPATSAENAKKFNEAFQEAFEKQLPKPKTTEVDLKFVKPSKKQALKLNVANKIQYKAPSQSSYNSERISNLLSDEAGQFSKPPIRPKNLLELKALCPFKEAGDERSAWIATERQKYGI